MRIKTDANSRKPEIRSRKSEVRSQKSDVRSRKSKVGYQKTEVGSQNLSSALCPLSSVFCPLSSVFCPLSIGRVLVLGLGNILLKDEGVGVHIAQRLQELALADNVEVMDGGTASLDVLLLAPGIEKLVVIDALRAGKEAGTIYKARLKTEERDKLEQIFSGNSSISLHQIGLIDALTIAERMNCAPKEIVIIGVEPKKIDCGLELTDEVKQRIPEIVNTVLKEIEDVIHTK